MIFSLENAALTDANIEVFACACAAGAMANLRELYLAENNIGDEGMRAFASTACASGAMTAGAAIFVSDTNLTV